MTRSGTDPMTNAPDAPPADTMADPVTGIIYNPRSHRNRGQDLDIAARRNVHVAQPRTRDEITEALRSFKAKGVTYLVVNGGDGTVRDVLTCGLAVFGADWPEMAVLPKGKTNALNVDLGAPRGWTVTAALDDHATARRVVRSPLVIRPREGDGPVRAGFIMGAGAYALGVQAGQDAHRMGAFDSVAVAVTTAWGIGQLIFGRRGNRWRQGARMTVKLGKEGTPLPHSGYGDRDRRSILMASTLQKFPSGLKLFGNLTDTLKLTVLDYPRRRLTAALPAILYGAGTRNLSASGMHLVGTERFELDIEDTYILDGEAFPGGRFVVESGPPIRFVVP